MELTADSSGEEMRSVELGFRIQLCSEPQCAQFVSCPACSDSLTL